jgi:hypothetical protein
MSKERDRDNKNFALLLAVNCVRNTIIEEYHSRGKLTDAEMMAFNKEVVNKIYTTLSILNGDKMEEDKENFMRMFYMMYPDDWDEPKLDKDIVEGLQIMRKGVSKI